MKILEDDGRHGIRGIRILREQGKKKLQWKYQEATHFLVALFPAGSRTDEMEALQSAAAQGIGQIAADGFQFQDVHFYLLKEGQFRVQKMFVLPKLEAGAFQARVFACVQKEADSFLYFQEKTDGNTGFLPVDVCIQMRYQSKMFRDTKTCLLYIPPIENYVDGAICYQVKGTPYIVPLAEEALGKELKIVTARREEIVVEPAKAYQNIYHIKSR